MEQIPKGARFEVVEDVETNALVHWRAPLTSGFHCVIPKGTILVTFRACSASDPAFGFVPEDYKGFEKHVPPEDRTAEKYAGYSFVFTRAEAATKLRRA